METDPNTVIEGPVCIRGFFHSYEKASGMNTLDGRTVLSGTIFLVDTADIDNHRIMIQLDTEFTFESVGSMVIPTEPLIIYCDARVKYWPVVLGERGMYATSCVIVMEPDSQTNNSRPDFPSAGN